MGERTGRPRGFMADPAKRRERARIAGKASARARWDKAQRAAARLSPAEAFMKGDRVGYARAYHYWQRWALRTVERLTGRSAFYAEAKRRSDLREAQSRSYRAPDEMGTA